MEILRINAQYKAVNFGQEIDAEAIEQMKPGYVDPSESMVEYRSWKRKQLIRQRQQLVDRISKFEENINNYRDSKLSQEDFRELTQFGYSKSKQSVQSDIKFVKVNKDIEKKVRSLLESTELMEIAKTARIVVEMVKEEKKPEPQSMLQTKKIVLSERH
jgi:hypothetical protein